jgi:hypothetical protein
MKYHRGGGRWCGRTSDVVHAGKEHRVLNPEQLLDWSGNGLSRHGACTCNQAAAVHRSNSWSILLEARVVTTSLKLSYGDHPRQIQSNLDLPHRSKKPVRSNMGNQPQRSSCVAQEAPRQHFPPTYLVEKSEKYLGC